MILLFSFCVSLQCFSQNNSGAGNLIPWHKGHHWRKTSYSPKVLLVQLRSEQNKIEHFIQQNKFRETNKVKTEASIIRKVMKNDFEENFSFCPVYYYMDTNAEMVKRQLFDNVLFTADGIPMNKDILHPGDTNYFIVYYGYPGEQMELDARPEDEYSFNNGEAMGRGLIFLNYKYQQIDFYYRFAYFDIFNKPDPRYFYKSADFDMEYYPFAAQYESDLQEKFNGVYTNRKLPRRY